MTDSEQQQPASSPPMSAPPVQEDTPPTTTAQWKSIEPEDRYFHVPHELLTAADKNGAWKIVGASIRGRGHAHEGKYREDSFAIDQVNGWNIIAVADGAGSRKYSRVGSKLATGAAVRAIKNYVQDNAAGCTSSTIETHLREALFAGLQHAYDRLVTHVQEEREVKVDLPDLACTLLLTIYCEIEGQHVVAGLQIGDGLIMVAENAEKFFELTRGDTAEFSGGTTFITSEKMETWLQREPSIFTLPQAPWLLIAMTDGVADDMVPYERNIPLFLLPGLQRTGLLSMGDQLDEAARRLAAMINYEKKASFDDRTLVVLFQHGANADVPIPAQAAMPAPAQMVEQQPDNPVEVAEPPPAQQDHPAPPPTLPEYPPN